ncbi:glycosyltransferase [bacterium]|nr:glycosyltransferase [bacterium]
MAYQHGITLCMIVKNEETRIKDCLDKISAIVDEIVVVDTGSTDKTVYICEQTSARIIHYQWDNNTAAARNAGLQQASYEWILVLDADETISQTDFPKIKSAVTKTDADGFVFHQRNYTDNPEVENWKANNTSYSEGSKFKGFFDIDVIRLFRNRDDIYYSDCAHELVEQSMKHKPKKHLFVPIHHFGLAKGRVSDKEKNEHYLNLIFEDYKNNPNSFKTCFLLGRQYYQLKNYNNSKKYLAEALRLRPNDLSAVNAFAMCGIMLNENNKAIELLKKAVKINPQYEEPFYSLSIAYLNINDIKSAMASLRSFLKINPQSVKGLNLMGHIYLKQNIFSMAETFFKKALKIHPHYKLSLGNLIVALSKKGAFEQAQKKARILLSLDPSAKNWIDSMLNAT